jgi:DNA-binding NarL/FixJ family response regulator
MSEPELSILICDDHQILTDTLAVLIDAEPGMRMVAPPVHTAADAVEVARSLRPDVVLMDVDLGGPVNGIAATKQITAADARARVIIVSGHVRPTILVESVEVGASGFIDKGRDVAGLLSAIRTVAAGGTLYDPMEVARLLPGLAAQRQEAVDSEQRLARLTAREREILQLLTEGHRNQAIADRLFISAATARTHIANILTKLGVHSQIEAVALASGRPRVPVSEPQD